MTPQPCLFTGAPPEETLPVMVSPSVGPWSQNCVWLTHEVALRVQRESTPVDDDRDRLALLLSLADEYTEEASEKAKGPLSAHARLHRIFARADHIIAAVYHHQEMAAFRAKMTKINRDTQRRMKAAEAAGLPFVKESRRTILERSQRRRQGLEGAPEESFGTDLGEILGNPP